MNRPVLYGRLVLAAVLPLLVAGLVGLLGWRAWQQQQAAGASLHTVQAAIATLKARQAEYQPGGAGYRLYGALLNSGFAAPASPPELRSVIGKLARQHEVAIQGIDIGEALTQAETQAGLELLDRPVMLTVKAANEAALYEFIDALRQSGHAELTLETLDLKSDPNGLAASLGFSWSSLAGAPQLEYVETPVPLSDALTPGKALFSVSAPAPAEAPAVMILKVEAAKP